MASLRSAAILRSSTPRSDARCCIASVTTTDMTLVYAGLCMVVAIAAAIALNELAGRPVPFLRLDFIRFAFGMRTLMKTWQVGDGREEAVAKFVVDKAPKGNLDAAIAAIDEYGWKKK